MIIVGMTILALLIAVLTVVKGYKIIKANKKERLIKHLIKSVGMFATVIVAFLICGVCEVVMASPNEVATVASEATNAAIGLTLGDGLKYLAAALSTGLATIGTGVAVGSTGSAAIGAVSEDASNVGKTLIFVGMGEGIAIYGMIISILILFV